jgi:hypothetical protein
MSTRARLLGWTLAGCLVAAGCGGSASHDGQGTRASGTGEGDSAPLPATPTPQPLAYAQGAKDALAGGGIAVVDLDNRVLIAPPKMDVNAEQRLSGLRWSGWGSERATGRADVRTLICDPDCAQGVYKQSHAELVLSAPKTCGGRRFYTRSSMTYEDPDTGKTRAPATYLRTPPC